MSTLSHNNTALNITLPLIGPNGLAYSFRYLNSYSSGKELEFNPLQKRKRAPPAIYGALSDQTYLAKMIIDLACSLRARFSRHMLQLWTSQRPSPVDLFQRFQFAHTLGRPFVVPTHHQYQYSLHFI